MIPVLTGQDDFMGVGGLGKGKLTDIISCEVYEELNGDYSLTFQYPVSGPLYSELLNHGTIHVLAPNWVYAYTSHGYVDGGYRTEPVWFDIYKHTLPINGVVTFYATHISRRLANCVFCSPTLTPNSSGLLNFNNNCFPDPATIPIQNVANGQKTVNQQITIPAPQSALATLIGNEHSLISEFGGDVAFFCKSDVIDPVAVTPAKPLYACWSWRTRRGRDLSAVIRYGYTMTGINRTKDDGGIFNAVVPYWDDGNGSITYVTGYVVQPTTPITPVKAVPMDCTQAFENQPTGAELAQYAQDWLDANTPWIGSDEITVDFLNDEYDASIIPLRIYLGDTVNVYWGDADVSVRLRCISYKYDVLNGRFTEIKLGTKQTNFVSVTGIDSGSSAGPTNSGGGGSALSAYPIGSIYMSVNSTSPAVLFGGTWERIQDRFLLAAGTTYTAGATGGEATHTLTTAEMPNHTHNIYGGSGDPPDWFGGSGNAYGIKQRTGTAYDYLQYVGGNGAHNNMPPYLVVYMWKRTA